MSISREQLMRYHDGELSEAEARAVELALEQEPALLEEQTRSVRNIKGSSHLIYCWH
ncbi:MAG TPA: zf-HC2 domain-containing protein [Polyangiaceae bacterium]